MNSARMKRTLVGAGKRLGMGRIGAAGLCLLLGVGLFASPGDPVEPNRRFIETVESEKGGDSSFEMVFIPGGTFSMGSPASEAGRAADEGPVHQVRIDPFYLAATEVTLELFMIYYRETVTSSAASFFSSSGESVDVDTVTGPTPVYGDMTMGHPGNYPAIGITWENAQSFCRWLSKKTGRRYRLPTEAEWELACRAGSSETLGPGKTVEGTASQAWFADTSNGRLQPVATKNPNPLGLYDMQGNVREWVFDLYAPDAYASRSGGGVIENPTGPEQGRRHVARGGDYNSPLSEIRPAARAREESWWRASDPQIPKSRWWIPMMDFIGFRVACSVKN